MVQILHHELFPNEADELLLAVEADIRRRAGNRDLAGEVAERTLQAVEFVLDPVRTGRTQIGDLDNVEKTFIGLKVEHFVRDLLDAPKGVRDLVLAGHDVDVKNTVGDAWCWMIPPETYRAEEPCLLIAVNEAARLCWMGLIRTKDEYLGAKNRDGKRRILAPAFRNIHWLVEAQPWPKDRWAGLDMKRFRELRKMRGGSKRAAAFFKENLRRPVHRTVVQALLHDQDDYMKRLRGNHGAKDILRAEQIALVSGIYFNDLLARAGLPRIGNDEHIAVDVRTPLEAEVMKAAGQVD